MSLQRTGLVPTRPPLMPPCWRAGGSALFSPRPTVPVGGWPRPGVAVKSWVHQASSESQDGGVPRLPRGLPARSAPTSCWRWDGTRHHSRAQGPRAARHGMGTRLGSSIPGPGGRRAVFPQGLVGWSRAVQRLSPPCPGPRGRRQVWRGLSSCRSPSASLDHRVFPGLVSSVQSLSSLSQVRFRGLSLAWGQGEVRLAHLPIVVFCGLSFKMTSEHRHVF